MMIEADPPLLVSCQIARIVRSALLEPFQRGGDRGRIEQRSERVDRDGQLMVSHDRSRIVMRIVGAEHRVSKTVKVEKAKQEDLTVSTRTDRDGNKDTGISVI